MYTSTYARFTFLGTDFHTITPATAPTMGAAQYTRKWSMFSELGAAKYACGGTEAEG
jgi:hypothetical protein